MASACALTTIAILAAILFYVLLLLSRAMELRFAASYAMLDCAPPPASDEAAAAAFRDTLLPLLAALPAAAAPTGFASLRSGGGAFARGLCLGDPSPRDCLACLAAAAKKLTGCGASRRAGVWRSEGCFLAYADGNTSSPHEGVFRDVVSFGEEVYRAVISVDDGTLPSYPNCFDKRALVALAQSLAGRGAANSSGARVVTDAAALSSNATGKNAVTLRAQCARDRAAAAECGRCLGDSAREVRACGWGLDGEHERVADVLGYNCFLRIETSVPPRPVAKYIMQPVVLALCAAILLVLVVTAVSACVRKKRGTGNVAAAAAAAAAGSASERCCKLREMESPVTTTFGVI
uniref:Gnk2-homologous domain-containing protein n=1 Tax=Triticum urartu TaxID=4572 RepID=A0A8R7TXE8_TRIUA